MQTRSSNRTEHQPGRLTARATTRLKAFAPAPKAGLFPLGLSQDRDGLLVVPAGYSPDRKWPVLVMLHGAGGNAFMTAAPLRQTAQVLPCIVVIPESRLQTWDLIASRRFGPDVEFIDKALISVFDRFAVDEDKVALGGFSDGASYALSLGLTNGDLFSNVIAFSPGFMAPPAQQGSPRIYVSHGIQDTVLPINSCSRQMVPALADSGYDVLYREFNGAHTVPADNVIEALDWFLNQ